MYPPHHPLDAAPTALHKRGKVDVVVFHHDLGLRCGINVLAVRVLSGVDAVRVDVVVQAQQRIAVHCARKVVEQRHFLRTALVG